MIPAARAYWEGRFGRAEGLASHANQNRQITVDFVAAARKHGGATLAALSAARSAVEFGCGTGEMLRLLADEFGWTSALGLDVSEAAAVAAQTRHGDERVSYRRQDALLPTPGQFDLGVCSNTLEHFRDPWPLLNGLLHLAPAALVLVPYAQPCTDGYDAEGGAGHVSTFTESSFSAYHLVDWFLFRTAGWQHSSAGEEPRQMAALVSE